MRRLALVAALTAAVGLVAGTGCTRLPSNQDPVAGPLEFAAEDLQAAIPMSYGELVSVTTNETFPGWAQLWFRRPDQSIVAVYVKYTDRKLGPQALVIPRS